MRIIYLDTLLAVNLFIDYVILCVIRRLLHINTKQFRLLLGACVGALTTLTVFLPLHSVIFSAFNKILSALLVIIISFGKGSFRKQTVRLLSYIGTSMILSTTVVLINNLLKPTGVIVYKDTIYFDLSPKILLISTAVTYTLLNIYQRLSSVHKIQSQTHKVTISADHNKKTSFECAVDTGCNLKEPFSGLPVILAEEALLKNIEIDKEHKRIIPYSTAAGSELIMGFKPAHIEIDGIPIQSGCYIGICKDKLKGEIKSIMGPEFMEAI